VGHLLRNRYTSIVVEVGLCFQELVRHIHLNPIRARPVADLRALKRWESSLRGFRRFFGRTNQTASTDTPISWESNSKSLRFPVATVAPSRAFSAESSGVS